MYDVPVIVASATFGIALAAMAVVIAVMVWSKSKIDAATREYREQKAALLARIDQMERQIAAMWAWATRQPHPPRMPFPDAVSNRVIEAMRTLFTREELEILAHEVGAEIEEIGGETLSAIAHRLWHHANARQMTDRLIAAIRRYRPNADV